MRGPGRVSFAFYVAAVGFCLGPAVGAPQGPGFAFQGQIKQAGVPVNGTCDFAFGLWDDALAALPANQLGATQTVVSVEVTNGLFVLGLNDGGGYGPNAFNGDERWLSMEARCPAGGGAFTPINPRTKINPVPYAQVALSGAGDGHSLDAADGNPTNVVYVNNDGNVGVGTTTPERRLDVRGDLQADGRTAFGNDATIGVAGGYDTVFDFSHTITDFSTAPNWSPFRSYITLDPSASLNLPSAIYGHDFETTIAAGNTQDFDYVQGPYLALFHRGSGDVDTMNGTTMGAQHMGPGTINYQVGAYVYSAASGLGTIENNYGLGIDCGHENPAGTIQNNYAILIASPYPHTAGALQNHYGIYLRDQDFGVNDSYAIYSAGGKSFFQDPVGIGTDDPQAMLHIGGMAGVDGVMFPDGTLQTTAATGGGGVDSVWSLNGTSAYYTAGRVGIGTSSPIARLDIRSGHDSYLRFDDAYGDLHVNGGADSTFGIFNEGDINGRTSFVTFDAERFTVLNDGRIGAGTVTPAGRFEAYAQATGSGMVAIKGTTEPSFDLFGNFFQGGIGVWGDAPSNVGVLGTSTENYGVKGESQENDGVHGLSHHAARSGVWGHNDGGGFGVAGSATGAGYAGVYGTGSVNGVFGVTGSGSASGVYGQNNESGWGVAGYAAGALVGEGRFGGTGVEGTSDGVGGFGVIGRGHGLNGVGVHAEAQNGSATALWAYNPGGRSALFEGYVDVYGALNVSGSASVRILTITGGADLAEPFAIRAPSGSEGPVGDETTRIEPGMVVVIDPDHPGELTLSTQAYDRKVAGIVSGANGLSPGMVMKSTGDALADGQHPVALTGRVWCWCDAASGAIQPGDMLTTSTTPGHAMKATDLSAAQGAIIGKAMTRLAQGEKGLVLVLVNLQ